MAFKSTITQQWRGTEIKIQGKKVINHSAFEIGLVVEGQAKELASRDYGLMAASINVQSYDNGTELEAPDKYRVNPNIRNGFDENIARKTFRKIQKPTNDNEVLVGTAVEYAPYQEFGTVKMPAAPFLRPALTLAMGKVLKIVKFMGKYFFGDYLNEYSNKISSYSKTEGFTIK